MTRIIGGDFGGRRIETPKGDGTRPTSDRVREALFSTLEAHFGVLDRIGVLDLYAGSGAIGLEASSRGASYVIAVEADRSTAQLIERNATTLGSIVEVVAQPVATFLAQPAWAEVDLVFLDPPYPLSEPDLAEALGLLVVHRWLAEDALVVVERGSRSPAPTWPEGVVPLPGKKARKKYGETTLWYAAAGERPLS
ncbi:16S rRNA (guanine(966)-N(2))-methyltransferase RsmD [Nocardioides antri]|uniref:16S rRNA (Guanine(966)-N(2))-methyltransferase RsmD n=1 Tax=Nocardioides antri TaxID=2607659 RepID=A0A5B1M061_9ACTN|nr:16S rRNA (guanine(966)-N(2))-methyltransferase RsmD [Nocardioides antri]KAA1426313.1 16S rRNA (guanine(966)-N(2))-methyltransferase RsmD [Nocardioides antri]